MLKTLISLIIFGCFVLCGENSYGQEYPSRPIRFISGASPGTQVDVAPRIISRALNERLGWQSVIENRPGGNYIIANQTVAQARPDGYTVLIAASNVPLMEKLEKDLPYSLMRDLVPVTRFGAVQLMVVAHPSIPANDMAELIAYSKANPGKLTYGGPANNQPYFAIESIKRATGLDASHVSYKSVGAAITDLLGGHISLTMTGVGNVADHVKSGRLKGLLILSPSRSPVLPNIQNLKEANLPPAGDADTWFSFFVPAGTPRMIVDRLYRETVAVLQLPEVRAEFAKISVEPVWDESPEAFRQKVEAELMSWEKTVRESNIGN